MSRKVSGMPILCVGSPVALAYMREVGQASLCAIDKVRRTVRKLRPKIVLLLGEEAALAAIPNHAEPGKIVRRKGVLYACGPDIDVDCEEDDLRAILKLLRKAMKRAGLIKEPPPVVEDKQSIWVSSVDEVRKMVNTILALPAGSVVCVDTETHNVERVGTDNYMLSIQFSWDGEIAYVLPIRHKNANWTPAELQEIIGLMRKVFTSKYRNSPENDTGFGGNLKKHASKHAPKVATWFWLFHNAIFDIHQIFREFGVEVTNNPIADTMITAYLLNENRVKQASDPKEFYFPESERGLDLNTLIGTYLGKEHIQDKADKAERFRSEEWDIERFVRYSGGDAWKTWRVFQAMLSEAEETGYRIQLLKLVYHLYAKALLLIANMERNGMFVDMSYLDSLNNPAESKLELYRKSLMDKIRATPEARRANELIWNTLPNGGANTLWGGTPWVLNLSKKAHARVMFFDVMGLDPVSYTEPTDANPEGTPQVNKKFFAFYAKYNIDKEPDNLVAYVSEWTQVATLMNNFVRKIRDWVHPVSGLPEMRGDARVRGRFQLTRTSSGRMAHKDPNMGQFPRADNDYKKATKDIFVSKKGNILLGADLMANEVRWGAILSGDENMGRLFTKGRAARWKYRRYASALEPELYKLYLEYLQLEKAAKFAPAADGGKPKPLNDAAKALKNLAKRGGSTLKKLLEYRLRAELMGDIHKMTASEFFGVPIEQVTKNLRTATKAVVFGYMYGRSVTSIAEQIGKSVEETQELCDGFDKRYPAFAARLNSWPKEAEQRGYVESAIGRRRRFHDVIWSAIAQGEAGQYHRRVQGKARRQAKNSVIQGIAADACMIAALLLDEYIRENGKTEWLIVNMVHDAIYMEVPFEDVMEATNIMEWCLTYGMMEYMAKHFGVVFAAPMECDFNIGISWGSMYTWDFSSQHLDIALGKSARDHKAKYGTLPKGGEVFLRLLEKPTEADVGEVIQLHRKRVRQFEQVKKAA